MWWFALALASSDGALAHPTAMVAARAITERGFEQGHAESLSGGGLLVEKLFDHHVAVELVLAKLSGHQVVEVPVELVLERYWEVGHHVEPFVGAGPMLIVRSEHDEHASHVRVGGVAAVGTHVWLGESWGLIVEADVFAVRGAHWAVGLEGSGGVVLRWR